MKLLKKISHKIFGLLLASILLVSNIPAVYAAGTAQISLNGPSTGNVGDTITLAIYVTSLSDGGKLGGLGGSLSSSNDSVVKVKLKSNGKPDCSQHSDNESMSYMGGAGGMIAFSDNGDYMVGQGMTIGTCKFEAVGNGTATITIADIEVVKSDASAYTTSITPKTITIGSSTPTPTLSSNAKLASLDVTGYTLSPAFNPDTISYTVTVPNTESSVTVTGTKGDSKQTITGLGPVNLTGNSTTHQVEVTAEDGTKKTYTITIEKQTTQPPQSSNAKLASLGVSGYTLSPAFNADTTSYTVTVPDTASTVTVVGTKGDTTQSISGLGPVTLTGDSTEHQVEVTAEDGSKKTYTITVKKQASSGPTLDSDSTLKDLTVGGTTIKDFSPTKTTYTIDVDKDTTSLNLAGIANSTKSTVAVSGGTNLKEGNNVATVTVTAEDGSKSVYTINIVKPVTPTTTKKGQSTSTTTKKKSSETGIGTFVIGSSHIMEPDKFTNDRDVYDITVPYEVEKLDLSIVLKDTKATYKVTGNENFQVGKVNVVTIQVTAEDGTTRTIILNVTRSTDVDGTKLTGIDIGGGYDINPKFDPDNLYYSVDIPGGVDKLDISTKAPEGSKVQVYGNDNLKEGWNTVLVQVEDKNGYTRTYTLNVYKDAKKILGLTYQQFAIIAGIIGGLLLSLLLILLLLARRKKEEKEIVEQAPIIDFKPEFNFGSRNGTDDDIVYPNAELNQESKVQKDVKVENGDEDVIAALNPTIEHKGEPAKIATKEEAIPYDPYDDIVTKDELVDAIEEGLATKNPEKLKMLLEQEELNRKKEALRKKEESNK